ncbi:MAG: hypothetical protein M5R36_08530 [Deltaproteobacteria bacterium]|nr:hypothetical protein [Deltaproteobacteria bacterium]
MSMTISEKNERRQSAAKTHIYPPTRSALDGGLAAQEGGRRESEGATSMAHRTANIAGIADILATGVLRRHLRHVRNQLKKDQEFRERP